MSYFRHLAQRSALDIGDTSTLLSATAPDADAALSPEIVEIDTVAEISGGEATDARADVAAPHAGADIRPALAAAPPEAAIAAAPDPPATSGARPAATLPATTAPHDRSELVADPPAAATAGVAYAIGAVREWIQAAEPDERRRAEGPPPGEPAPPPVAADRARRQPPGRVAPPDTEQARQAAASRPRPDPPPAPPAREIIEVQVEALPAPPASAGGRIAPQPPARRLAHPAAPVAIVPPAAPADPPGDTGRAPTEVLEVSIGTISVSIEAPPPPRAAPVEAAPAPAPVSRALPPAARLARHYIR